MIQICEDFVHQWDESINGMSPSMGWVHQTTQKWNETNHDCAEVSSQRTSQDDWLLQNDWPIIFTARRPKSRRSVFICWASEVDIAGKLAIFRPVYPRDWKLICRLVPQVPTLTMSRPWMAQVTNFLWRVIGRALAECGSACGVDFKILLREEHSTKLCFSPFESCPATNQSFLWTRFR
jgi:hypothetical protein